MKKIFLTLNIIFATLTVISDVFYALYGGLWLKGVTSSGFVIIGIINLIYVMLTKGKDIKFAVFMLVGLVLSLIADIVLNIEFMIGAVIFALAHVVYIVAYSFICKINWKDFIPAVIIFVPSVFIVTLVPLFDFGGVLMEVICALYALVISCMVGKAISNYTRDKKVSNLLIIIGSALFFISDLMLLFDVFAEVSSSVALIFDTLCLATYWPAQIILAYSIFHKTLENKNE